MTEGTRWSGPRVSQACSRERALMPLSITSHQATPTPGLRTSWLVDDYFLPGPRPRAWMGSAVIWFHRTVEAYVRETRAPDSG